MASKFKRVFILRGDESQRQQVKRSLYEALKALLLGKAYKVTIEDYIEDKTAEQRSFFHVLCKIFGDETGYTQEEIKQLVKYTLMGTTVVTLAGKEVEVIKSSETLKRDEYSELIETTYRLAAEAGIQLPNARWR